MRNKNRFEKKATSIDGKKVLYWQKNNNKRKTIVFLHGFPGSHGGLVDLANGLSEYRLVIPDLPGCGRSEPLLNDPDLKNYAKWLHDFLDELSLDQIILIGHSFGSRLSLVFSELYPKKLENMILITPVVNVEGLIARSASIEYKLAEILPKNLQKMWLSNRIYQGLAHIITFKTSSPIRRNKLIAKDRMNYELIDPDTTIGIFEEFYRQSLIPEAKKIKTNTLVIAGDKDEIAPLVSVKELSNNIIHSEMFVMKNAGHLVVLESPLSTATIIRKWLKEQL
ncbi:MAG: alpha/beta hydrolase [bacterium]